MQIQAAAAPAQPLEVINDLRRYCFGDIRKTLDQITNMMTMAEMLRMMNEPSQKIIAKKNDSKNRKISFKTDMSPIGSITI
ncbi:MAG: hypothetical protein ACLVBP_10200 [Ruminococcus sp.]